MAGTSIRAISVDDEKYSWCIRGNDVESKASHITIFHPGKRAKQLYVDPYPWELEIRPKTVELAIRYALENGWLTDKIAHPMYLGYLDDEFIVLPKGVRHTYELKSDS